MSRKGIGMMTAIVAAMGITGSTRPGVYTIEPTATVKRTGRTYYSGWYPSTLGRKGVRGKSAPNNRRTTKLARAAHAAETDALYGEPLEFDPLPEPQKSPETFGPWRKTHATFYGPFYDSGPGRKNKTSDGTPYRPDGMFCATYLVPLGTVIEVKRGKVVLRLVVRDRPAKVNGHKIDIPTLTWDRFGAKRSIGKLPVEWREVGK